MIHIAIVDDEERIRLGMAKLISQIDEKYKVIASYSSAYEMLANLSGLKVDLVITDIKMPNLTGLELIAKAKEARPDIFYAILSGFDDFTYAREAIRQGAVDYLLKPVDKSDLKRLLDKVEHSLEQRRNAGRPKAEDFLKLLLINDASRLPASLMEEAEKELEHVPLLLGKFAVFAAKGAPLPMMDKMKEMAMTSPWECIVLERDDKTIIVLFAIGGSEHADSLKQLGQVLLLKMSAAFRGRIGCSHVLEGARSLRLAYLQAEQAIERSWYSEGKAAFQSYGAIGSKQDYPGTLLQLDKAFRDALALAQYDKAEQALRQWAVDVAKRCPSWNDLQDACAAMYSLIDTAHNAPGAGHSSGPALLPPDAFADWRQFQDDFLTRMLEQMAELKASRQENRVIEKVKAYINQHFTEEMDLTRLAEEVYLTPSYLSKLFKTETGETLTDYHISARIERAKQLLKEDLSLKTYEVGERVGYLDPAYFNKIFKKTVGCTPKEYRERVR
ncbi:response regulator [Paenibacillus sp. NEAU-GSW1]|uniref:response regulator n=1 Tax=Paenibacillus sp. NEAU-GSW1 TaxID=2682486 RepID=UPI0012E26688|nr:response regulator [Paenibacillus sp. NEAU-GSW1]MUT65164.1 response regulator [Paenibacillus sp. NEAU-GSW1]